MRNCPDCNVTPGTVHSPGCDVERCPMCKMQLIGCGCIYKVNGMDRSRLEVEHPDIYGGGPTDEMCDRFDAAVQEIGGFLPWTGEWPGVAECREFGWFCQDGHGFDPKVGGFCPCPPNAPGAMEDINRWVRFLATGVDNMYEGCTRQYRVK